MKTKFYLILSLFTTVCFLRCSPEHTEITNNLNADIETDINLNILLEYRPEFYELIDKESKEIIFFDSKNTTRNPFYFNGFELEKFNLVENGKIVGYYIIAEEFIFVSLFDDGGSTGFSIDFFKNNVFTEFMPIYSEDGQFSLYDITNDYLISIEHDTELINRSCSSTMVLCSAACTLGTIGMGAADGPLPFGDILAAAFWSSCQASCASAYRDCMNSVD